MDIKRFTRELDKLSSRLGQIAETKSVPFQELFHPTFMKQRTCFLSFDEMIESSGFRVDSEEDFEAISEDKWGEFVSDNTSFSSWDEMLSAAGEEWLQRKLDLAD